MPRARRRARWRGRRWRHLQAGLVATAAHVLPAVTRAVVLKCLTVARVLTSMAIEQQQQQQQQQQPAQSPPQPHGMPRRRRVTLRCRRRRRHARSGGKRRARRTLQQQPPRQQLGTEGPKPRGHRSRALPHRPKALSRLRPPPAHPPHPPPPSPRRPFRAPPLAQPVPAVARRTGPALAPLGRLPSRSAAPPPSSAHLVAAAAAASAAAAALARPAARSRRSWATPRCRWCWRARGAPSTTCRPRTRTAAVLRRVHGRRVRVAPGRVKRGRASRPTTTTTNSSDGEKK